MLVMFYYLSDRSDGIMTTLTKEDQVRLELSTHPAAAAADSDEFVSPTDLHNNIAEIGSHTIHIIFCQPILICQPITHLFINIDEGPTRPFKPQDRMLVDLLNDLSRGRHIFLISKLQDHEILFLHTTLSS